MVQFKKGKLIIQTNLTTTDLHTILKSSNKLSQELLAGHITHEGREAMANLQQLIHEFIPSEEQFEKLEQKE